MAKAMTACVRSDCSGGVIDEDGYCNQCQRAPGAPGPVLPGPDTGPGWPTGPWDGKPGPVSPRALTFSAGPARALARAALGLGIVAIPALPVRDPDTLLLDSSVLEEPLRRCPNSACRSETGRGPGGNPGQSESRCPRCGTSYSVHRALLPGEDVGQYRVRGCIGYGGQGWVYLASDRNLDDDPVAIKGLRDTAGTGSGKTAAEHRTRIAAERRALIEVKHPDIVDIRNFVQHREPLSGRLDDYIVLEFVDGESLAQKAVRTGVLPVAEAIAYILAVLPALGYLHDSGLVYSDFKPANIMHVGDRIKLVDLGGVSRIGARAGRRSRVVTTGFTAPEILSGVSPSISSDLYTVGRTLAVLTAGFDHTGAHETSVPGPGAVAAFSRYESFYRFLLRAANPDPEQRFTSAAELAEQLTGVLREVVAFDVVLDRDRPPSAPSALFTVERGMVGTDPRGPVDVVAATLALPRPRVEESDPAAGFLATVTATEPDEVMAALQGAPPGSAEAAARRVLARIGQRNFDGASTELAALDPHDWRFVWYRGLLHLARVAPLEAGRWFAAIRDALPGEPAPKLALAVCAEALDETALARHYYQTVWRTDHTFVGAAFGVARTYVKEPGGKGTDHAVKVLTSIPETLHHHLAARVEALYLQLSRSGLDESGLRQAAAQLQQLSLGDEQTLRLTTEVWKAARDWLAAGGAPKGSGGPLGDLTPLTVGRALEDAYLASRRYAPTRRARVELVRQAHAARPRTLW
jgi:serine/threonine-protein kinase PknG